MKIEFDFQMTGETPPDPYLDDQALAMMFENTRIDLTDAIERKLGGMQCVEHHTEPAVLVRGTYDREMEQMDISYGVDTCCQPFLMRVVQILHRIG